MVAKLLICHVYFICVIALLGRLSENRGGFVLIC